MGNLGLVMDTGLPDGNHLNNNMKFSLTRSLPNIQHKIVEGKILLQACCTLNGQTNFLHW